MEKTRRKGAAVPYKIEKLRKAKRRRIIRGFFLKTMNFLILFLLFCIFVKVYFLANETKDDKNVPFKQSNIHIQKVNAAQTTDKDPQAKNSYDEELIRQLESMRENQKVSRILSNLEQYPEDVLTLYLKNPETLDFVLQYPERKNNSHLPEDISVSDCPVKNGIPLFIQWDSRWGYCNYGERLIAQAGCGPTALSMVLVGLTGDSSLNPGIIARYSEENGYLDGANGTLWSLMTYGAEELGLSSRELSLDEHVMIQALRSGNPIICSMRPGDFTTEGHFIVLTGYENGLFIVNDPNSLLNSDKKWSFSTLQYQIKNLWAFSK